MLIGGVVQRGECHWPGKGDVHRAHAHVGRGVVETGAPWSHPVAFDQLTAEAVGGVTLGGGGALVVC